MMGTLNKGSSNTGLRVVCVLIVIVLVMSTVLITPQISRGTSSEVQEPNTWVNYVVISEVLNDCSDTEDHEFIELYNPTNSDISLIGWDILYESSSFVGWDIKYTISASDANGGYIPAYSFYLIGEEAGGANDVFNVYGVHVDNTVAPGINLGMGTNSHVGIRDGTDTLIDRVGQGTATWPEDTAVPQPPTEDSVERRSGLTHDENSGNGWDTDHNLNDFIQRSIPEPQNSTSLPEGEGVDTDLPELIYANSTSKTTVEAHFNEPVNTSDVENITNWKIIAHSDFDTNPPYVLDCKATSTTNVEVIFSEAVNSIDANDIMNYQIDGGVSVTDALPDAGLTMVNLTTTPQTVNITHNLTIDWINDTANPPNMIAPNTQVIFNGGGGRGLMRVVFIDVEQGDATLIISPMGNAMLIDGGPTGTGAHILDVLSTYGLTELKYTVATHYHEDHIGALDEVINGLGGSSQITNASYDRGDTYGTIAFTDYVNAAGSKRKTINKWDVLDLGGGVTATCVGVNGNGVSVSDENDKGVVLRVDYYNFQMYLAGDLGGYDSGGYDDVESTVANDVGQVEVYQVDHHGSEYSSNSYFLSVLDPTVSVFSVGNNGYGHVTAAAYDRVKNQGSYIYYTNTGGGVTPGAGEGVVVNGDINLTTTDGSAFVVNGDNYLCSGQSDTTPPEVIGTKATSLTHVELTFNEPINQTDAGTIMNYIIDGGIGPNPSSAVLKPDLRTVNLTTGLQTGGQMYNITINNIRDRAPPPNTIQANSRASFTGGQQTLEIFDVVQDSGNKSIVYLTTEVQSQIGYTLYAFDIRDTADPPNNQPETSIDFFGGGQHTTFDIPVLPTPGWNLVSFSLDVVGSVQDILDDSAGDGSTTWNCVYWYDANDLSDHWKSYKTYYPGPSDLVSVNNTMGLWIYITDASDGFLTVEGTKPNSTSIDLKAGWNLVGYPSATPKLASDTLPAHVDKIAVFDQPQAYHIRDVTDLSSVTMSSGNAYWVHCSSDTIWTVDY